MLLSWYTPNRGCTQLCWIIPACSYTCSERERIHPFAPHWVISLFARASADRSTNQSILSTANPLGGNSLSLIPRPDDPAWAYISLYQLKRGIVQIAVTTNPPHFLTWMNIRWLRLVCRHLTPLFPVTQKGKRFWCREPKSSWVSIGIFYFFCCYRADFFHLQTPPSSLICSSSTYYFRLVRACNTPESTVLEVVLL